MDEKSRGNQIFNQISKFFKTSNQAVLYYTCFYLPMQYRFSLDDIGGYWGTPSDYTAIFRLDGTEEFGPAFNIKDDI